MLMMCSDRVNKSKDKSKIRIRKKSKGKRRIRKEKQKQKDKSKRRIRVFALFLGKECADYFAPDHCEEEVFLDHAVFRE